MTTRPEQVNSTPALLAELRAARATIEKAEKELQNGMRRRAHETIREAQAQVAGVREGLRSLIQKATRSET